MRYKFFSIILLIATAPSAADAQTVTITSPPNGAIYHPGDTINVQVAAPSGTPISVLADWHFTVAPLQVKAAPYNFTVTLPADTQAGSYTLSVLSPSTNAVSQSQGAKIEFSVEPGTPNAGATLSVVPAELHLKYVGQKIPIEVYLLQGGNSTNVSYSSQLQATSATSAIASVQGVNVSAGTSPGSTSITFTLGGLSVTLPVYNAASNVQGDLNGDGRVDIDDLNILDAALNLPANTPNDARDLNHDGVINALDARILTTLCTYPRCATHQ